MKVTVLRETRRGCGYRNAGKDGGVGIYLMGNPVGQACERLPFPVETCPCCGGGSKVARSWRTITPSSIFLPEIEPECDDGPHVIHRIDGRVFSKSWPSLITSGHDHANCPMCNPPDTKHGLVWIGHQHYTVASFLAEADERGVSKRLSAIPRNLEIGETFVYLAHIKAVGSIRDEGGMTPGVFMVFKPTHIDLVIDDSDDVPDKAVRLVERLGEHGRLVKVERM